MSTLAQAVGRALCTFAEGSALREGHGRVLPLTSSTSKRLSSKAAPLLPPLPPVGPPTWLKRHASPREQRPFLNSRHSCGRDRGGESNEPRARTRDGREECAASHVARAALGVPVLARAEPSGWAQAPSPSPSAPPAPASLARTARRAASHLRLRPAARCGLRP